MIESIAFEDVSAELAGQDVLRRVSFAVAPGEIAAVFGGAGSGKSSLLHVLCGLLAPSSGVVRVLDRPVTSLYKRVSRAVSLGMQSPCFAPELSVQENLELQAALWGVPWRKRINRVAFVSRLLGLDTLQRIRASRLSDGQKKALEIARALIPDATVVALDSLVDYLDPNVRGPLFRYFFETARKDLTTFLISTSSPDVAEMCDRVVMLRAGQAVGVATPEEIHSNAPDSVVVVRTADNPLLRRKISERFQVVVREDNDGLRFSLPNGDQAAAEILSSSDSQVACIRVRRQNLFEILDSLPLAGRDWRVG